MYKLISTFVILISITDLFLQELIKIRKNIYHIIERYFADDGKTIIQKSRMPNNEEEVVATKIYQKNRKNLHHNRVQINVMIM